MSIESIPVSPIRPIRTNVTLTCTIVLGPVVDIPVTVNIQLNDSAGSLLTTNATTPLVSGSTHTTITTVTISSFGRDQSGVYTCRATISSTSSYLSGSRPLSATAKVTVGKLFT